MKKIELIRRRGLAAAAILAITPFLGSVATAAEESAGDATLVYNFRDIETFYGASMEYEYNEETGQSTQIAKWGRERSVWTSIVVLGAPKVAPNAPEGFESQLTASPYVTIDQWTEKEGRLTLRYFSISINPVAFTVDESNGYVETYLESGAEISRYQLDSRGRDVREKIYFGALSSWNPINYYSFTGKSTNRTPYKGAARIWVASSLKGGYDYQSRQVGYDHVTIDPANVEPGVEEKNSGQLRLNPALSKLVEGSTLEEAAEIIAQRLEKQGWIRSSDEDYGYENGDDYEYGTEGASE